MAADGLAGLSSSPHHRIVHAHDAILDDARRGRPVSELVTEVLAPSQRAIGEAWLAGTITVADEHAATAVVDELLWALTAFVPAPDHEHTVAMVCAEGEWHVTPSRMAALVLRDAGWRVRSFGGSTPPGELARSLATLPVFAVALSCTRTVALDSVPASVGAAAELGVPTIVGGHAFGRSADRAATAGAAGWCAEATDAPDTLARWLDDPPSLPPTHPLPGSAEANLLSINHHAVVAAAAQQLDRMAPTVGPRHARRRRERLTHLLDVVAVATLYDDAAILGELHAWTSDLHAARDTPSDAFRSGVAALQEALPVSATSAHRLLAALP